MSSFDLKSNNPMLKAFGQDTGQRNPYSTAAQMAGPSEVVAKANVMTVGGTVNATFILLGITVATAILGWRMAPEMGQAAAMVLLFAGCLGGCIAGGIMHYKPKSSPIVAPLFAVSDGLFTGFVSFVYAKLSAGTKLGGATGEGIVFLACGITFAVLAGMLVAYKTKLLRATETFQRVMRVATIGISIFALVSLGVFAFGGGSILKFGSPIAFIVCGGLAIYAALRLILDFNFIEQGAAAGLPKHMEWYGGFSLMFTLVYLYLEVLRLLAMFSRRD